MGVVERETHQAQKGYERNRVDGVRGAGTTYSTYCVYMCECVFWIDFKLLQLVY